MSLRLTKQPRFFARLLPLFLLLGSSFTALSQTAVKKPTPQQERPREIVALLSEARLAAPELATDTFLRVVESKKIVDPAWRREILEEAWRMADEVTYPLRRDGIYFARAPVVDTEAGYMSYAYDLGLDTLSLKARIIKNFLGSDLERGQQLLLNVRDDLRLTQLKCDDAMGYDVRDIYITLGETVKSSFTANEIRDGNRALFILPWVENIESPAQLLPIVDLVLSLKSPPSERSLLMGVLEKSLKRSFNDDRSFSHIYFRDGSKIAALIKGSDETTQIVLTSAWRDFLDRNAKAARCEESRPKSLDSPPYPLAEFNAMFPGEPQFSAKAFESVEYNGSAKLKIYLNSPTFRAIDRKFRTARDIKNHPSKLDDKDAQLEWELKVGEVLAELDSWKASENETEAHVFNQKCVFYRVLSQQTEGNLKTNVLRAYMRFLAGSSMQKKSFIEWLYYTKWVANNHAAMFKVLETEFPNPNFSLLLSIQKASGTR